MQVREITYSKVLDENAKKNPDGLALFSEGISFTYSEMKKAVDVFSAQLVELGVKKGDHVALWAYNHANWVISMQAIIKAGGVAVLLNYSLPSKDLDELVKFTKVKFILYGNNRETKLNPDAAKIMGEKIGLSGEKIINISADACDFKKIAENKVDLSKVEKLAEEDDPHRSAVIIFTTGTTALPKAVQLSQYSLLNDAIGYGDRYKERHGEKICVSIPLFHSFGLLVNNVYFLDAATVYLHEEVKPSVISKLVGEHKISDIVSVGSVYLGLVDDPEFSINMVPYIKTCLIGGGFSTPVQMMRLEAAFKNGIFLNGYGQTESSPALSLIGPNDKIEKRANTVGRPLDGAELKIWDSEKGFLTNNEIGEVVARGYYLMNGYFDLPEEKQSIDKEGWLHTGDLGFLDDEGFLHLTGRIKDIIIKSGENILPVEIEQEIMKNEAIREVKVLGAPDYVTGESVQACVVMNKDYSFDEDEIKKSLKGKVSNFKIPSHVFCYDKFPVAANGKLDQRGLKADMLKRLGEIYLDEKLTTGLTLESIEVQNILFMSYTVINAVKAFAEKLSYSASRVLQICLAVESLLHERMLNAYSDVGEITVRMKAMKDSVRIEFSDSGDKYFAEKNQASNECAANILKYVDKFSIDQETKGHSVYCMDFLYPENFDIKEFILKAKEIK